MFAHAMCGPVFFSYLSQSCIPSRSFFLSSLSPCEFLVEAKDSHSSDGARLGEFATRSFAFAAETTFFFHFSRSRHGASSMLHAIAKVCLRFCQLSFISLWGEESVCCVLFFSFFSFPSLLALKATILAFFIYGKKTNKKVLYVGNERCFFTCCLFLSMWTLFVERETTLFLYTQPSL